MIVELGDTVEARTIFMAIIQGTVIGVDEDRHGAVIHVLTSRGNVHRCRANAWFYILDKR